MDRELEIEERDLGAGWVEAYYLQNDISRWMAIQEDIPDTRVRLYELAAHGLGRIPMSEQLWLASPYKDTDFVFYVPRNCSDASALLVRAVSEAVREMEPGWVSAVEEAPGLSAGDPDGVAFWSEVPIEAVLAILDDRHTRF